MDWHRFISEILLDLRHPQPKHTRINKSQCSQLSCALSSKLSKYWSDGLHHKLWRDPDASWSSDEGSSRRNSLHRADSVDEEEEEIADGSDSDVLANCQHALKEVYRVLKDAEIFVQACSAHDWWKAALTKADTGEALAVHLHDLVWSVAALDAAIHHARSAPRQTCDTVCSRRVVECYGEFSRRHHKRNESVDRKQLLSVLQQLRREYESMSSRRKRTLRIEEENKYRIASHLLRRLQGSRGPSVDCRKELPASLSINPNDLDFSKRRLLGRGSYGAVYEASWFGVRVAVKELPCMDFEGFKEEASILAKLRSPFIVQLIGWSVHEEGNVCYLVMELANSSLGSYIEFRSENRRDGSPFSVRVAVDIMLQISRGMDYLHGHGVVHRDLRASNVLVDLSTVREFLDEGYVRVKLCDFGMAKAKITSSRFVTSMKGASYWRAPEVFRDPQEHVSIEAAQKYYTKKADVYSFAITCYEILTGQQPFAGVLHKDVYNVVMEGVRPELPATCPTLLTDYIKRCWQGDANSRPSFHDISKVLRHVKMILMRIDDPEDVSFLSVTSEYDYMELSNQFCSAAYKEEQSDSDEDPSSTSDSPSSLTKSRGTSTFQRIRSVLSFLKSPLEINSKETELLGLLPGFITKFTVHELRTATANFSERIGQSESGCVCRGILSDKTIVSVKIIELHSADDVRLLCMEVAALANAYHTNVVRFLGFCLEASYGFLVCDYMVNLSLDKWLTGETEGANLGQAVCDRDSLEQGLLLDWDIRFGIALGTARGLAYLHEDCGQCIYPVGIKSSKILLDGQFEAKINNFSALEPPYKSQLYTHTISLRRNSYSTLTAFSDPVFAQKSDVYGFGIVLLELVVGHEIKLPKADSGHGLVSLLKEPKRFLQLLDNREPELDDSPPPTHPVREACSLMDLLDFPSRGNTPQDEVKARMLSQLALWCVQDLQSRPTMSQVVQILEGQFQISPELWPSFGVLL